VTDLLRRHHLADVERALAKYPPGRGRSAVLDLLYLAQAAYGRITDDAVREVADIVAVDPTHVQAVVGFYTLFFEQPHGGYVVQYCNDLPCALRGADAFLETVSAKLGCAPGATSADGLFTLETVMCLAACDKAPLMQINLEYFENLTAETLDQLVTDLREKAAALPPRRPPFGYGPPSQIRSGSGATNGAIPTPSARAANGASQG
jgi:NADH-quinone oxidoreductase subunit E